MVLHGTARVSEIGGLEVPWNSIELVVSAKLAHLKFHGIPWNWSCQRNWRIPSSMEYHGTARVSEIGALEVPWNSMEFHGTARVSEIRALQVPWNSMEFHGTARVIELVHSKFHGIPWKCWCQFHGIPWNLILLFNEIIGIINTLSFKMV